MLPGADALEDEVVPEPPSRNLRINLANLQE